MEFPGFGCLFVHLHVEIIKLFLGGFQAHDMMLMRKNTPPLPSPFESMIVVFLAVGRWDISPQLVFPDLGSGKGSSLFVHPMMRFWGRVDSIWEGSIGL